MLKTHNGDMEVHLGQGMKDDEYGYYFVRNRAFNLEEELIDDKMVLIIFDEFWSLINSAEI